MAPVRTTIKAASKSLLLSMNFPSSQFSVDQAAIFAVVPRPFNDRAAQLGRYIFFRYDRGIECQSLTRRHVCAAVDKRASNRAKIGRASCRESVQSTAVADA